MVSGHFLHLSQFLACSFGKIGFSWNISCRYYLVSDHLKHCQLFLLFFFTNICNVACIFPRIWSWTIFKLVKVEFSINSSSINFNNGLQILEDVDLIQSFTLLVIHSMVCRNYLDFACSHNRSKSDKSSSVSLSSLLKNWNTLLMIILLVWLVAKHFFKYVFSIFFLLVKRILNWESLRDCVDVGARFQL